MADRLKQILDIAKANSEDAFEDIIDLMKPEGKNRYEMGETFEEVLGYDPITYYDKQQLGKIADEISLDPMTPSEIVDYLKDKEQRVSVINRAYEIFEEERDETFLPAALEEALEEETGVSVSINVEEDDYDYDDDGELDDLGDSGDDDEDED